MKCFISDYSHLSEINHCYCFICFRHRTKILPNVKVKGQYTLIIKKESSLSCRLTHITLLLLKTHMFVFPTFLGHQNIYYRTCIVSSFNIVISVKLVTYMLIKEKHVIYTLPTLQNVICFI